MAVTDRPSPSDVLLNLNDSELILLGNLNGYWLSPTSDKIKALSVSLNLTQFKDTPTMINPRDHSILDVILTTCHTVTYQLLYFAMTSVITVLLLVKETPNYLTQTILYILKMF